jgi:hypothetical protein
MSKKVLIIVSNAYAIGLRHRAEPRFSQRRRRKDGRAIENDVITAGLAGYSSA